MKSSQIYRGNRELCTGCAACSNICMHNAITMTEDWKGFQYPQIDSQKCVDCNLCQTICPANQEKQPFIFPETYAFVESNTEYLNIASSGGAFGVIARYVLSQSGIVFGATIDTDYNVYYTGIETLEDLKKLHGSKYVQANIGHIYRKIKKELSTGRQVLFCGCPCQVAGLAQYLRIKYDNLLTMDLICHGVPSQPYFKSYVKDLLKHQSKEGITSFKFRHKRNNDIGTDNKIYIGDTNKDYYMTYFMWGKGYRPSCYNCKYAGGNRPGDFTIGDYWNNKRTHILSNTSQGSSLILFNTPKSIELKDTFSNSGEFRSIETFEEAMGNNGGQLHHPSKNDIRTYLLYLLWKLLGAKGPKLLFRLEDFRQ